MDRHRSPRLNFELMPVSEVVDFARETLDRAGDEEGYWAAVRSLQLRGSREAFDAAATLCSAEANSDRELGANILAQFGNDGGELLFGAEAVSYLLPLLADECGEVRASAAGAFGYHTDGRAVPMLLRLAESDEQADRFGAVFGLRNHLVEMDGRRIVRPDVLAALRSLSSDPDRDVRDWATFELCSVVELEIVEPNDIRHALDARLDDEDAEIRSEAMESLARSGEKSIEPLLIAQLDSEVADGCCSLTTLEAARHLASPNLVKPLDDARAFLIESGAASYFVSAADDALAACRGSFPR